MGSKSSAKKMQQAQQQVAQMANDKASSGQAGIAEGEKEVGQAVQGGQQSIAAGQGTLADAIQKQLGLYQPYINAGTSALSGIQDLSKDPSLTQKFSFNPSDLGKDPGYAFTLQQGQDAIARSAAAQGGLLSGGTLKSLAGYTTGTANQYFNDAYNRSLGTFQANQQQALNRIGTLQNLATMGYSGTTGAANAVGTGSTNIANLGVQSANLGLQGAGLGLSGAEASGQLGMDAARTAGSAISGGGMAAAAGTAGATNNWLGALSNINNNVLGYLQNRGGGFGRSPLASGPSVSYGQSGYQP